MVSGKCFTWAAYLSSRFFNCFICVSGPVLIVSVIILVTLHGLFYANCLIPNYSPKTILVFLRYNFTY